MLATYLTVILLLLLLMGVTVSSMFRNQYLSEQENSLQKELARVNTILEQQYVFKDKQPVAESELLIIARNYDALIQVVDQWGKYTSFYDDSSDDKWGAVAEYYKNQQDEAGSTVVSLSGIEIWPEKDQAKFLRRAGSVRQLRFARREPQPLSREGELIYGMLSEQTDMPTLTLVRAFYNGEDMQGAILMHLNMSSVNASIAQVYMEVLLIGLMAVAAAVLAVSYLTTRITKPITNMNAIVQRYSKGSFELRLDPDAAGAEEVAQLARSFNNMADAVSSLEQTRRSFVANVSHELRSPLTSISGFLEAIQDGTIPEEKRGEYLDLVIGETKRMTGMVNNLLDLARIESGKTEMSPSVFDMNELARRTVLTFEARINAKKLDVALSLAEPGCIVEADAGQIGQVLRNLIDNAIKFSPEGGRLEIETTLIDRRTAGVSVQDYGSGIPKEDVRLVFDRFYKAEKAHTPSAQSGTGLGLSIARVIMDQHGQEIFAESEPGKGTKFTFTLRRAQDPRRRADNKPEERDARQGRKKGEQHEL